MNDKQIRLERDGLILTGPAAPMRDAYIRVRVEVTKEYKDTGWAHNAWAAAVSFAYDTYGAIATEDNTIGQLAQVEGIPSGGARRSAIGDVYNLGLNLYGMRVRDVKARIAAAVEKYKAGSRCTLDKDDWFRFYTVCPHGYSRELTSMAKDSRCGGCSFFKG